MFDWSEYYLLAKSLAGQDDEASQRSAVSRAYYAAFCSARNQLRQEGESIPNTGKAHEVVWDHYQNNPEKRRRQIGQQGKRLRRKRNRADYDDEIVNLDHVVRDAMETADSLLSLLRSL
ncbi:MAG: hypothetical protein Kow00106_02350 [Anaerolineae bacterium]